MQCGLFCLVLERLKSRPHDGTEGVDVQSGGLPLVGSKTKIHVKLKAQGPEHFLAFNLSWPQWSILLKLGSHFACADCSADRASDVENQPISLCHAFPPPFLGSLQSPNVPVFKGHLPVFRSAYHQPILTHRVSPSQPFLANRAFRSRTQLREEILSHEGGLRMSILLESTRHCGMSQFGPSQDEPHCRTLLTPIG